MMSRANKNYYGDFEDTFTESIENYRLVSTDYYVENAYIFK